MEETLLDKLVDSLIEEKIQSAHRQTKNYSKCTKEIIDINNSILTRLGDEKHLLLRSEELSAQCLSSELRYIYKQGLLDGIKLILEVHKNR
ncbi:MAG: hypothetical protein AB7E31_16345 [Desulfitobacterium sp.]